MTKRAMSLAVAAAMFSDVSGLATPLATSRSAVRSQGPVMGLGSMLGKRKKAAATGPVPDRTGITPAVLRQVGIDEEQQLELLQRPGTVLYMGSPVQASGTDASGKPIFSLNVALTPLDLPVTEEEVLSCQANWANAIKSISATYLQGGDYIQAASGAAGELYGYGKSEVLFKPTKATDHPFRPTGAEAMSYFVGGSVVDGGYVGEDAGFAINGGKGWADVVFTNHKIDLNGPIAIAMGSYVFTCATTGDKVTVEYTFGYKRNDDGKARIFLHHSSVPYSAAPAVKPAELPVTEAEVLSCQAAWANAIASISATYAAEGDYIQAAANAAGELYGYGHTNVLFKPTKATTHPFRPTGGEAMSYFVGGDVVENGYVGEDAGFAINGGKGWKKVVFTNHQIDLNGPVAIAMGSYDFTCATTGDVATVEYTFGYKRNEDGKARIFLHHSSVPYDPAPKGVVAPTKVASAVAK